MWYYYIVRLIDLANHHKGGHEMAAITIDMRDDKTRAGVEAYVDICGDVFFTEEEADFLGLDKVIISNSFFGQTIEQLKKSFRMAIA
jgi:hypothetical protein